MLASMWADFSVAIVSNPIGTIIKMLPVVLVFGLMLHLIGLIVPKRYLDLKYLGGQIKKLFLFIIGIPSGIIKRVVSARIAREELRQRLIKEEARKLVGEVKVEIREIDAYTYCYDCDIHYNRNLADCPNCFAIDLSKGDAKAVFSILKGVREFRYLSFDREQDLIKYVCEKMTGETINDFGKKD